MCRLPLLFSCFTGFDAVEQKPNLIVKTDRMPFNQFLFERLALRVS